MSKPDIVIRASELGLTARLRLKFQQSKSFAATGRLSQTMAAAGHCYGLRVWLSGGTAVLLDDKGFVAATSDWAEVLLAIRFESTLGPGALRVLLSRPVIDPMAAVSLFKSRFSFQPLPAHKGGEASANAKRSLSRESFSALLDKI